LSYYLYFITLVAVGILLFAKPLILLLSGAEYLPAVAVIPPLTFVYVLSGVSQIISIGAMISKNTRYVGLITPAAPSSWELPLSSPYPFIRKSARPTQSYSPI
jgi:hypothetical protein